MSCKDAFKNIPDNDEYLSNIVKKCLNNTEVCASYECFLELFCIEKSRNTSVNEPDKREFFRYLISEYRKFYGNDIGLSDILKSSSERISLNSWEFTDRVLKEHFKHVLCLNVSLSDLYFVLIHVMKDLFAKGINFKITIPYLRAQDRERNDMIMIYCSTRNVETVLDVLGQYKKYFGIPGLLSHSLEGNIGYISCDKDTSKLIRDDISKYILMGINNVLCVDDTAPFEENVENILNKIHDYFKYHGISCDHPFISNKNVRDLKIVYPDIELTIADDWKFLSSFDDDEDFCFNDIELPDGTVMSVYEYLDKFDVFNKIPVDSKVLLADGTEISGRECIKFIIKNAPRFSSVDEIIEIYVIKIVDEAKKGKRKARVHK